MNILFNQEETLDISKNTIFLAGPTSRVDTTNSWRKEAFSILNKLGFDGNLIIPEPRNNKVEYKDFDKIKQITWERKYLSIANIIIFWIPRDTKDLPGFTTNIEFGEWCKSNKIILGYPDNAEKMDYINFLYNHYRCTVPEKSLFSTLKYALDKLNRPPKIWFTSDTHFGQLRTLQLSKRDFINIEEMDLTLISNWNSLIYNNDLVFHLGDFGEPYALNYLSGKEIKLLVGNYDNDLFIDKLIEIDKLNRVKITKEYIDYTNEIRAVHEIANIKNENKFYLYGHIHQLQMVKRNGLNVGTDCHKFKPVDLDTIYFYKNAIQKHYDENVFIDRIGGYNDIH